MKFLHISDMHFHRHDKDNKATKKLLKYVHQNYPHHYLVITGDITDDGAEEQYGIAHNALKMFEWRLYPSPGNHDAGKAGNLYQRKRLKRFDRWFNTKFIGLNKPKVDKIVIGNTIVALIGLDSNRETWWPGDWARGRIGIYQRWCLKRELKRNADAVRMVYFHHHLFIRHILNKIFLQMTDANKLMEILAGNCEVVMFGHKHHQERWQNHKGIPHVLAAGAMSEEETAWEITIEERDISVKKVPIT